MGKKLESVSLPEIVHELRLRAGAMTTPAKQALEEIRDFSLKLEETEDRRPLIAVPSGTLVERMRFLEKSIYGSDDRVEPFQVTVESLKNDMDCVVVLVRVKDMKNNGDGTSTLSIKNFGQEYGLCSNEPFRNQPIAGFCSGFLVAPNLVATAGHCVMSEIDLASIRFVFGFRMISIAAAQVQIKDSEIYAGKMLIKRVLTKDAADWALVELDRSVSNHQSARVRRSGIVEEGRTLHVIGHPRGLPLKFAGGTKTVVRDTSPSSFFTANLDTYGGNSGSPVFSSDSHLVEGILVRGDTDFIQVDDCYISRICPNNGCRGEDCTRATEFAALVPN